MAKRAYALMVVLVLLAAGLLASLTMAQGTNDPSAGDNDYQEEAIRRDFDEDGKRVTPDDHLSKIAREVEGGFGGYYFNETDPGHVYVFMKDTSKTKAARSAIEAAYDGDISITQISLVQGQYAFNDLLTWYRSLTRAMAYDSIPMASGAVMETKNRIVFGLPDMSRVSDIRELMGELEIPTAAVIFGEEQVNLLTGKDSVRAKWRPVVGGIQHQITTGGQKCTIGFVTERAGVEGLVLASHCTNEDKETGQDDDSEFHQPNNPLFGSNKVAEEDIDPPLTTLDGCPPFYICRYSDAAFARLDSEDDIDLGEIAKPEAINETDVDPAGTTFRVTSDSGSFSRNDNIYYVGRVNGWHTAQVIDTCSDTIVKLRQGFEFGHIILCAGGAVVTGNSANPANTESGSPVFIPTNENNVKLIGTPFSGTNNKFNFSKIGSIYYELGASSSWNSCVSGC